jgi:hypothetical protein
VFGRTWEELGRTIDELRAAPPEAD